MWKVVPMCEKQLRDINENDILHNGYFRKCNTYKSGGGYDKFPQIAKERLNMNGNNQFVVQLYGCTLDCPYCYVTRDGIWREYKKFSTDELINYFIESKQDVFHLMGGSPALYLENWYEIINKLPKDKIFHSDLLLVEKEYKLEWLNSIKSNNSLYAVNIKGVTSDDFYQNTNRKFNEELFYSNFDKVVESGINFYLTFTNPDRSKIIEFVRLLIDKYGRNITKDAFIINLIDYDALKD